MSVVFATLAQVVAQANVELDNEPRTFLGPFGQYEDLTSQLNIGVEVFAVGWKPVATPVTTAQVAVSTLSAIVDGMPVAAGSITVVDPVNGLFSLPTAPTSRLIAAYQYLRFTDTDVTTFVNDACNRYQTYPDVTKVPQTLFPALYHWVKGIGYGVLASRYAEQVNVALGPRHEDRAAISAQFMKLSGVEYALGDKFLLNYYTRAGQREAPAVGRTQYVPNWNAVNPVPR